MAMIFHITWPKTFFILCCRKFLNHMVEISVTRRKYQLIWPIYRGSVVHGSYINTISNSAAPGVVESYTHIIFKQLMRSRFLKISQIKIVKNQIYIGFLNLCTSSPKKICKSMIGPQIFGAYIRVNNSRLHWPSMYKQQRFNTMFMIYALVKNVCWKIYEQSLQKY